MASVSDRVAQVALHHYHHSRQFASSSRGKPKEDTEWTVYAALVAQEDNEQAASTTNEDEEYHHEDNKFWVVSCATGTKCTPHRQGSTADSGRIVRDCHAEVLVRRGLVWALWKEILQSQDGASSETELLAQPHGHRRCRLLEPAGVKFRLKAGLRLHLYISDSPCGDATIYSLASPTSTTAVTEASRNGSNTETTSPQFTGSKLVVTPETGLSLETTSNCWHALSNDGNLAREPKDQLLGCLRSKSSHSNVAHRSSSMSCSDKLVRWQVFGWQGSLLSSKIVEPIRISSVVVSRDPREVNQEDALRRALVQRSIDAMAVLQSDGANLESKMDAWDPHTNSTTLSVHIVSASFARSKSQVLFSEGSHPRKSNKRKCESMSNPSSRVGISPCGFAINWNYCASDVSNANSVPEVEVLVGARGLRQGKKPTTDDQLAALQSRLSRANLAQLAMQTSLDARTCPTYEALKRRNAPKGYLLVQELLLKKIGPLAGWLVTNEESDFAL